MKRFFRAAAATAILTSGLASVGCVSTGSSCGVGGVGGKDCGARYRNAVDPCYPERYQYAARQAVIAPFAQQVHNGYILNQTIWNYYFEAGSDKLTPAGLEKLDSLARVRPTPDPKLFIQTARDLPSNVDPLRAPDLRAELDAKRAAAIQKYLGSLPAFGGPVAYEVFVHDSAVPGIYAEFAAGAYRGSAQGYRGGVNGGAGQGALGTGGGTNLTVAPVINNAGAGGLPR